MNAPSTLIVASRNDHKVREIRSILEPFCQVGSMLQFEGAPEVVEDAPTFTGNAIKKASLLAAWLASNSLPPPNPGDGAGWLVLADDSGLEVDALGGAPGVRSARFAALDGGGASRASANASDAANNEKLLRLLEAVPMDRRSARFRCVLALVEPGAGAVPRRLFEGTCEGTIGFDAAGAGGFGYDPLFLPEGFERSFAELGDEVKNRISHRARALAALKAWLLTGGF